MPSFVQFGEIILFVAYRDHAVQQTTNLMLKYLRLKLIQVPLRNQFVHFSELAIAFCFLSFSELHNGGRGLCRGFLPTSAAFVSMVRF